MSRHTDNLKQHLNDLKSTVERERAAILRMKAAAVAERAAAEKRADDAGAVGQPGWEHANDEAAKDLADAESGTDRMLNTLKEKQRLIKEIEEMIARYEDM